MVRVIYADGFDEAPSVQPSAEVVTDLEERLNWSMPISTRINAEGEPDESGAYLAFIERSTVMAFLHPSGNLVSPVGEEGVPLRWDCFRGATTEEAGREPYRYDITDIAHPDAELLIRAVNEYEELLGVAARARTLLNYLPLSGENLRGGYDVARDALVDCLEQLNKENALVAQA